MKLIAHRGNINGPNPETENTVNQIDKCIEEGYDVEIDLWYNITTQTFWLGHDHPKEIITFYELAKRSQYLWVHCKDITTLDFMSRTSFNFFGIKKTIIRSQAKVTSGLTQERHIPPPQLWLCLRKLT